LVIDADAVLALAVATQSLQPVTWWRRQVAQLIGGVKPPELSKCWALNALEPFDGLPIVEALCIL
jgi:hypothetical protein